MSNSSNTPVQAVRNVHTSKQEHEDAWQLVSQVKGCADPGCWSTVLCSLLMSPKWIVQPVINILKLFTHTHSKHAFSYFFSVKHKRRVWRGFTATIETKQKETTQAHWKYVALNTFLLCLHRHVYCVFLYCFRYILRWIIVQIFGECR